MKKGDCIMEHSIQQKKIRHISAFILGVVIVLILSIPFTEQCFAGTWEEKNNEWYYLDDELGHEHWIKEYGYKYYIFSDGKMATDEISGGFKFNTDTNTGIPYGALLEDNQVFVKEMEINKINFIEIKRNNCDYNKVVIMLHGLGGRKEDYKGYGCKLAAEGCLVILPEAHAHGDSYAKADYPDIIVQSSKNIDKILNYYKINSDMEVDIIGCSMGGMIGSYYVYKGSHKVSKLAMLMSTPDLYSLENKMFFCSYKNGEEVSRKNIEEIKEKLGKITPLNNILKFRGTKIYMINITEDPYIPYSNVKEFVTEVKTVTDVELTSLHNNQHSISKDEFDKSISFVLETK
jgi:esterase/lipase